MRAIPITDDSGGLSPADRQDLIVLLRIIEGWLLAAEPGTIRELDSYLLSEGISSSTTNLLSGIERLLARLIQ